MLFFESNENENWSNSYPKSSLMTSIQNSAEKRLNPQSTYIEGLQHTNTKNSQSKNHSNFSTDRRKLNMAYTSTENIHHYPSKTLTKSNIKNLHFQQQAKSKISKTLQLKKESKNLTPQKNINKSIIQTILLSRTKIKQKDKQNHYSINEHLLQFHKSWQSKINNLQYPFRPKIAQLPKQIYSSSENKKLSKQERYERLIQNLRNKQVQRWEQKVSQLKQKEAKQCTFQPNITKKVKPYQENISNTKNKKTKIIKLFYEQNKTQPLIHEKLYLESKQIKQKHEEMQKQKINQQKQQIIILNSQQQKRYQQSKQKLKQLLYQNHHTQKLQKYFVPLHQRTYELKQNNKQVQNQLKEKYLSQWQSRQLQMEKMKLTPAKTDNLIKRLVDDYLNGKIEKQQQKQQQIVSILQSTCPFTPSIAVTDLHRDKISENKKSHHNLSLSLLGKQKKQQYQQHIFIPEINLKSKVIVENFTAPTKQKDFGVQFDERLFHTDFDIIKLRKLQKIQNEMDHECTFKPSINALSKQLKYQKNNQNHTVPPRHQCPQPSYILKQQNELTFHPSINQKSKCMTEKERLVFLEKKNKKSKQKLNKIHNQLQYKQVEECTFFPKTISTTQEWKRWKQQNLNKNKLPQPKQQNIDQKSAYNKIQPYHSPPNNKFVSPPHQPNLKSSPISDVQQSMVKGFQQFMDNRRNIERKKQDHLQRLNKIFNFQQKYDQRIIKQQRYKETNKYP